MEISDCPELCVAGAPTAANSKQLIQQSALGNFGNFKPARPLTPEEEAAII